VDCARARAGCRRSAVLIGDYVGKGDRRNRDRAHGPVALGHRRETAPPTCAPRCRLPTTRRSSCRGGLAIGDELLNGLHGVASTRPACGELHDAGDRRVSPDDHTPFLDSARSRSLCLGRRTARVAVGRRVDRRRRCDIAAETHGSRTTNLLPNDPDAKGADARDDLDRTAGRRNDPPLHRAVGIICGGDGAAFREAANKALKCKTAMLYATSRH